MDHKIKSVFTDRVCKSFIIKKYKIKETNSNKKVGPSTLVINEKNVFILKEIIKSKKVGPSTLVNNKILLFHIINIVSVVTSLSQPISPYPYTPPSCLPCPTTTAWQWPPPTWPAPSLDTQHRGTQWSYSGIGSNKLVSMINGNRLGC